MKWLQFPVGCRLKGLKFFNSLRSTRRLLVNITAAELDATESWNGLVLKGS